MLNKDKAVQGYAVYCEFNKGSSTFQMIFTPDGFTSDGKFVPMKMHRRVVSADSPKKQWKTTAADANDILSAIRNETAIPSSREWAEVRLAFAQPLFSQIALQGWTPAGPALTIEVSKIDMDDISAYKTPTKVIYRINQSRALAGYPADLY